MKLIRKRYLAAAFLSLIASLLGASAAWSEAVSDTKAASGKDGADCFFVGAPRIECRESPAEGIPRMCWFKAGVRNRGSKTAQHAYVMCVTRHRDTGELAQLTWRRIGFGFLKPSDEKDVKVPYQEPDIPERDRRYEYSALWKNRGFPNVEAEQCEITEKIVIRYEAKDGEAMVRILGFIMNSGESSGFAPRLMAKVTNEKGEVVRAVSARVPQLPLDPNEKLPFIITLPAIEEDFPGNFSLEFEAKE